MNKNKTQPATYKPFASMDQQTEWIHKNCDSCKKGFDRKAMRFRCTWEFALCLTTVDKDGTVPVAVAKAIGMLENEGCDLWECPGWAKR